ncbi:hypothetical protein FGG08_002078 [Glutinoglossum americanum]|uniref:RGS domain-containing protein n=1 Tax=Glutinoglossum americanum TaxID=1670608 RepID=A0A9P8IDK6_9PEZI|nr:hypothetical protein FGG08_002078 [Glutinoglossum americanum]
MIGRKSRRTPTLFISTDTSRNAAPGSFYDCEADDEGTMSTDEYRASSRPLSVAIPQAQGPYCPRAIPQAQGPYCPRWPTLAEILSNTAPPPWTLSQFMAYLSQNHCLETLEFTMDASRYRKHYNEAFSSAISPDSEACSYVKMLWQRLLDAYITPNGPREVNLPSDVRDRLLSLPNHNYPPPPDSLDQAVKIIYELMDGSVLVPFLNSISNCRNAQSVSPWNSSDENVYMRGSLDDRMIYTHSRSRRESSPPPPSMADFSPSSYSPSRTGLRSSRILSPSSQTMSGFARNNRLSAYISSGSSYGSGDMLTDDSGSASSASAGPMTPPTTPPTSDAGGSSPKSKSDNTWKKMTGRLGWKKKSIGGLRDHHRCPELEDEGHLL